MSRILEFHSFRSKLGLERLEAEHFHRSIERRRSMKYLHFGQSHRHVDTCITGCQGLNWWKGQRWVAIWRWRWMFTYDSRSTCMFWGDGVDQGGERYSLHRLATVSISLVSCCCMFSTGFVMKSSVAGITQMKGAKTVVFIHPLEAE